MRVGGQEDRLKDADGKDVSDVDWFKGKLEPYLDYKPVITSYDYDSPISEAGDYNQPGIGPPPDGAPANKFQARTYPLLGFCRGNKRLLHLPRMSARLCAL